MITSTIGRQFLTSLQQKYGQEYDATTFLTRYSILYSMRQKYMMTEAILHFENPKIKWDDMLMGKRI